jgi:hypothetical protein
VSATSFLARYLSWGSEVAESFRIRDEVVEVKVFKPLDLVVQGEQAVGTVRDYAW